MPRKRERLAISLAVATMAFAGTASPQEAIPAEVDDPVTEGRSLPPGHPSLTAPQPPGHGRQGTGRGAIPGVFEPPEDLEQPDPALAPGTIVVDLFDADNQPVPHEIVTLGMLINSIAKGDSRKHVQQETDLRGRVTFTGLQTASNIAYRVTSGFQGGAFGATPFQLEQAKAMHVVLHVYPVTHDLRQALVVAEVTVAAEVREDRIQIEEILKLYNLGRLAWQPENVRMGLPEGFTAFNVQASMSDQRVEQVGGDAELRGTFAPGRHSVEYRWQLPWSGETDLNFDVGLPPHVALARVVMPASAEMTLTASGFPAADLRRDAQGQKFLVTERHMRPDDGTLTALAIGIHGLPVPGPGRLLASLLAACAVAAGLALSFARRPSTATADLVVTRSALLDELAELERAHATSEVGPRTYERMRRELLDALARTLARAQSVS